jgi:DNA (cytosine-5)-methyltransferase 1
MTHGSLFSGIGGFDLAAEWIGWDNKFHCEWNEFGQKVLKYYWPNAESFTDIKKTNFTKYEKKIDVLTGGFPCQPYSSAGKRKGKDDERHLWPEMCRAIREIKPRWIVGENVYGLVNWSDGLVFHEVQTDLENEGYEVQPFLLPAAAVNAPHRRDRIFFIAYANSNGRNECDRKNEIKPNKRGINAFGNINKGIINGYAINPESKRFWKSEKDRELERRRPAFTNKRNNWDKFPTQSPICTRNDGLSDGLDGIAFSKWRKESIKAGGNAICPQVAYQIFLSIQEYENINLGTEATEQQ